MTLMELSDLSATPPNLGHQDTISRSSTDKSTGSYGSWASLTKSYSLSKCQKITMHLLFNSRQMSRGWKWDRLSFPKMRTVL